MRALLACVALLTAASSPPRDWATTLRQDAKGFHDLIAANHPGPYNPLDPGFAARNDAGLEQAMARAPRVRDYAGYLFAMQAYVARFDDGHVQFGVVEEPKTVARWPPFLTGFDGAGRQVVMTRTARAPVPLGSELVACDGRPAAALAARLVGDFYGRWALRSQHVARGGRLFVDLGNPFVARPSRCSFGIGGRVRTVTLAWTPLSDADLDARFAETRRRAAPRIATRILPDGTRWLSISDFDGDPAGPVAKALVPMIAALARDRAAAVVAPRIILDLRGDGGASSDWSRQIATILWGPAAVDAAKVDADAVEWRASAANLATLVDYRDRTARAATTSAMMNLYFRRIVDGLQDAIARRRPLWREPDEPRSIPVTAAKPTPPLAESVYLLTDSGCASACLDAADLWIALGAIHVGQETSADTLYMDLRSDTLPSGIARTAIPMKVYRGRKRGSNVPLVPRHICAGDLRDTPALERWIARLP